MQKVQLFSIDQQQNDEAWLNDTAPMPVVQPKPKPCTDLTEHVCRCIARFVAANGTVPAAIRANPCTVFGLPGNRWEVFPFLWEGRIVEIMVIADRSAPAGEIICEKGAAN